MKKREWLYLFLGITILIYFGLVCAVSLPIILPAIPGGDPFSILIVLVLYLLPLFAGIIFLLNVSVIRNKLKK